MRNILFQPVPHRQGVCFWGLYDLAIAQSVIEYQTNARPVVTHTFSLEELTEQHLSPERYIVWL